METVAARSERRDTMATTGTLTLSYSDVQYLIVGIQETVRAFEPPPENEVHPPLPLISAADDEAAYSAAVAAYHDLFGRLNAFLGTLTSS